jgi:hypothetical protein
LTGGWLCWPCGVDHSVFEMLKGITFSASRVSCDFGDDNTSFAYCIGNCRREEVGSPFSGYHKQNCIFACESNHVVAQNMNWPNTFLFPLFGST